MRQRVDGAFQLGDHPRVVGHNAADGDAEGAQGDDGGHNFPGHPPIKPQLKYLQRDPSIQNLVAMRMDETSPLMRERFMLNLSQSSGMKENDAVKIDAVLKGMKCSGNTTVASEAKNEARRYLEYEIEF